MIKVDRPSIHLIRPPEKEVKRAGLWEESVSHYWKFSRTEEGCEFSNFQSPTDPRQNISLEIYTCIYCSETGKHVRKRNDVKSRQKDKWLIGEWQLDWKLISWQQQYESERNGLIPSMFWEKNSLNSYLEKLSRKEWNRNFFLSHKNRIYSQHVVAKGPSKNVRKRKDFPGRQCETKKEHANINKHWLYKVIISWSSVEMKQDKIMELKHWKRYNLENGTIRHLIFTSWVKTW